ncbi:hypothetical protein [Chitinasiproducens palmae]|uniref:Uncharacterized protein n=1 Tax=Chitinasiproducens palmae TaxID=1770053 RepID=A0A1H2PSI0_9BURK|nr:hypothetical protein [Chitinasiproducens palmae]SDV49968.1 hypothetical protein SAMN05216551_11015 [Chitinasiproducens palmae]
MANTLKTIARLAACAALVSCGGGGSGDDQQNNNSSAATASTEGLWTGTIKSSVTNRSQPVTLIALPTGEMRLLSSNCVQYIAATSINASFFSGSGNGYAPDGGVAACPIAYTFPSGSTTATVNVSGQAATRQTLYGSYSAGGDTGTFTTTYNDAYGRTGTLARVAGTYSNGTVQVTITATGSLTGLLGSEEAFGTVSTIDVTKNAYRIVLNQGTPASAATSSASAVAADIAASWSGVATLVDYSSSTDNALVVSLSNQESGFTATLIRQ